MAARLCALDSTQTAAGPSCDNCVARRVVCRSQGYHAERLPLVYVFIFLYPVFIPVALGLFLLKVHTPMRAAVQPIGHEDAAWQL